MEAAANRNISDRNGIKESRADVGRRPRQRLPGASSIRSTSRKSCRSISRACPSRLEDYYQAQHGYLSLESRQLILGPEVATAALTAAQKDGLNAAPTLVYLTKIEAAGVRIAGIVGAVEPGILPPLAPFCHRCEDTRRQPDRRRPSALETAARAAGPRTWNGSDAALQAAGTSTRFAAGPYRDLSCRWHYTVDWSRRRPGSDTGFPGITDQDDARNWKLPFEDPHDKEWSTDRIRQNMAILFTGTNIARRPRPISPGGGKEAMEEPLW